MYYFAYIDADNICTSVYQMPSDLSAVPGYVAITEEQYTSQSVIGKRWVASTGQWVEVVVYYYAVLDSDGIVINLIERDAEQTGDSYVAITKEQYEAQTILGYWYDRETQTFLPEVPFAVIAEHSTDEINVGTSNVCLTDKLTELETAIENAGTGSGSGTPGADGADGEDGGYYTPNVAADGTLTWTASKAGMPGVASVNIKGAQGEQGIQGVPGANGQDGAPGAAGQDGADGTTVVVGTVTTGAAGSSATVQGVLNEETNTLTLNFTIPQGAQGEKGDAGDAASVDAYTRTETDNLLNGKADIGHGHDYAPTTHSHSTSDITGLTLLLNGKADSSHTHSNYATSSHTHSNYFPTSGGTITGDTNFSGGLVRLKGVQTLYNSGTMITLSSNNVETMIAGKAIYSKVAISVSSDERVKENITPVDAKACIDFINAIDVKTFNYKGNETPCVGVIAQQIEKLSPELAQRLVTKDADGMLGVKTSDLVFPLIVAVQSLSARVAELEKK